MTWPERAATSHYQTAVAIKEQLQAGNYSEATAGIEELIEALSRSERRALKSQLTRLMAHIIKWRSQPEQRRRSWQATIYDTREEIVEIQEETPSLNEAVIRAMWDKCFQTAKRHAEADMEQESTANSLSWEEVFSDNYQVEAQ
jgi:hypothetical protein